jgi:hypothetical protein
MTMESRIKIHLMGWALGLGTLGFVAVTAQAGSLEPSGPPASTMQSLDHMQPTWDQILPASERFVLVMGGAAVLDKETGLVWEQSPSTSTFVFADESAASHCTTLPTGGRLGWRLPTIQELASLVDPTQSSPSLPSGHPFSNVQSSSYWSASAIAFNTVFALYVNFSDGIPFGGFKTGSYYVWCVRGGQGVDVQ